MARLVFAPSAKNEIANIATEIEKDNPSAAGRWVLELENKCKKLASFPRMGRQRDDIRLGVFMFPYGKYLIIYEILPDIVTIVHVVHGARNLPEVFRSEEAEEPTPSKTR